MLTRRVFIGVSSLAAIAGLSLGYRYLKNRSQYPQKVEKPLRSAIYAKNRGSDFAQDAHFHFSVAVTRARQLMHGRKSSDAYTGLLVEAADFAARNTHSSESIASFVSTDGNTYSSLNPAELYQEAVFCVLDSSTDRLEWLDQENMRSDLEKLSKDMPVDRLKRVTKISTKLGDYLAQNKEYDRAITAYQFGINLLIMHSVENTQGSANNLVDLVDDVGPGIEALADTLKLQKRYTEAFETLMGLLQLLSDGGRNFKATPYPCRTALVMNNLSDILSELKRVDEAETWLKMGIGVAKSGLKSHLRDDPEVCEECLAVMHENLATLYILRGNELGPPRSKI